MSKHRGGETKEKQRQMERERGRGREEAERSMSRDELVLQQLRTHRTSRDYGEDLSLSTDFSRFRLNYKKKKKKHKAAFWF